MAIYVCSDLHGQYDLYKRMLKEIEFSDQDQMYILGDLIDRGKDGIKIIMDVIERPNIACLLGNHELMMIDYLSHHPDGEYWTDKANGGTQTKKAFNALEESEKKDIREFLNNLYLQYEIKINNTKILLSHTDFIPEVGTIKWKRCEISHDLLFDLVWKSPWRLWEYTPLRKYSEDGRKHVIGHVPVQYIPEYDNDSETAKAYETESVINIDCGLAAYGKHLLTPEPCLCCMNLTKYMDGEEAFEYFY